MGLARQVWMGRNAFIHEGISAHPNALVQKAQSVMDDFDDACRKTSLELEQVTGREKVNWKAPADGMYKANWDAALNPKSGRIGVGIVIRDKEGNVKAAQSSVRRGILDPTTALSKDGSFCANIEILSRYWPDQGLFGRLCKECGGRIALFGGTLE